MSTYNNCNGGANFLMTIKTVKESGEVMTDRINWWEGKKISNDSSLTI